MSKIKIIYLLIFLLVVSCGYEPLYLDKTKNDFNLKIIKTEGDNEINQIIFQKLNLKNKNSNKNYLIEINSNYEKKTLGKNLKGNTSNYEIEINVFFKIILNNQEKKVSFKEKMEMQKIENSFDELKYEKTIKKNLVENIEKKLIMYITTNFK